MSRTPRSSEEALDLLSLIAQALPGLRGSPTAGGLDEVAGIAVVAVPEGNVVRKPWGEERWLLDEHSRLVLKLIHLRGGTRTSLQLHQQKEEASLVLWGRARLVYGSAVKAIPQELERGVTTNDAGAVEGSAGQSQRELRGKELLTVDLAPGALVHIRAGSVHRIQALTDVLILEVSTPEVDDVVRMGDDWGRPDGRVGGEHQA